MLMKTISAAGTRTNLITWSGSENLQDSALLHQLHYRG